MYVSQSLMLCFCISIFHYSLYTFDMRNMSAPINVHMGHVSAGIYLSMEFI